MRIGVTRWQKRTFRYTPQSRRRSGRPTTQWIEGIAKNMRDSAIKRMTRRIGRNDC